MTTKTRNERSGAAISIPRPRAGVGTTRRIHEPAERGAPLLCELHSHSTWSDGSFPLRELIDLYGANGFDVLCVSDHVVRSFDDPWSPPRMGVPDHVHAHNFDLYLAEVDSEAERALDLYGLLVIPGLELTYNDPDPRVSAHAVAVGLRSFVSVDEGIEPALVEARAAGAALIAAHPYSARAAATSTRATALWEREWRRLHTLVDRFELVNRQETFDWVARVGLPAVASGDFHRLEHMATWKTALPCGQSEQAVVDYLRSTHPAYLTSFSGVPEVVASGREAA